MCAGWAFPKLCPWYKEIDKGSRVLTEAGLINYYKLKTGYYETRRRFLENDKCLICMTDKEKIIYVEPPVVAPMNLDDLQPIFYLLGLGLSFSLIAFLIEGLMGSKKSHTKVIPAIQKP